MCWLYISLFALQYFIFFQPDHWSAIAVAAQAKNAAMKWYPKIAAPKLFVEKTRTDAFGVTKE